MWGLLWGLHTCVYSPGVRERRDKGGWALSGLLRGGGCQAEAAGHPPPLLLPMAHMGMEEVVRVPSQPFPPLAQRRVLPSAAAVTAPRTAWANLD